MSRVEEPNDIVVRSTIPCDFKILFKIDEHTDNDYSFLEDGGIYEDNLLLFSHNNNIMVSHYYDDSDCEWYEHGYFAVMERANGLNYFNSNSWERFPDKIQEAYTSYIADGVLLADDKPTKKTPKKGK